MRRRKRDRSDYPGCFAYDGLDRVLHERARLGIVTALVPHPGGLPFPELKGLCALTDGNLSRHLDVLRASGAVELWKGVESSRSQTICRLSLDGRHRLAAYLEELERVVLEATSRAPRRLDRLPDPPPGFRPV